MKKIEPIDKTDEDTILKMEGGDPVGIASWTFKGNQRISHIPPCEIDEDFLKKLFQELEDINSQALKLELEKMDKFNMNTANPLSDEDFEKLKKQVEENFKVHIGISSKDDYISSDTPSVLEKKKLPSGIMRIKFDNKFFYKAAFNKEPYTTFVVELDFYKPPLRALNANPSEATQNNSTVQIFGEDATWVEGTHSRIFKLLDERKTRRAWFHKKNIYDLFLLLLILPIIFWNLYKLEIVLHSFFSSISPVFVVGFYLYIFLIILFIFSFVFFYLRWLFPYIEFCKTPRKGYRYHRTIISVIVIGVITKLVYDIIIGIFTLVF